MGINVLSLFNGISCGRVALERAGIEVDRYVSYEIDKYANQVAYFNYPNDEYCGDVTMADFTQYKGFDLVVGGSPCTFWSIAQKNNRETEPSGLGYDLFMQFVRAVKETNCKYFLYENNYSIDKKIKAAITKELGVSSIMINSALLSAQNRKREYWTNIPNILQPQDECILLKDTLESGVQINETTYGLAHTIKAQYYKNGLANFITNGGFGASAVAEPLCINNIKSEKSRCIDSHYQNCEQDLLPRMFSENKAKQQYDVITQPIRIGDIGSSSQAHRVYSVAGKSVTINANGGGQGGKTGLYACPIDSNTPKYPIYEVVDGMITVNDKSYPIKLSDGYYLIRKLTVNECERLQTLPDNYCNCVSNSQAYKGIGNGWTVDVIAHILKNIK